MSTIDEGNVFLQAGNGEQILVLLHCKVTELMVRVNPTLYRPHITYLNKGLPMLYVRLSKALEGVLVGCSTALQETKKGPQKHGVKS